MAGPPAHGGVRICPGCGVIAPLGRADCTVCKTPFGAGPPIAPGRVGPLLFGCIHECDFVCNACNNRTPLPAIEIGGQAECLRCGINQAFDVVQWTDALEHAHNTIDLCGPAPEGQNPIPGRSIAGRSQHAQIGLQYTSSTKTQQTLIMDSQGTRKHSLRTTVSPGHPLCTTCRVPLEVTVDGGGTTRTRCPKCNDGGTYALPPNAQSVCRALRGIVAAEHRTDKPIARIASGQGGVEAVVCPQCGAALAAGEGELVKCTFCSITARVPGKLARRQRKGEPPPMVPFWVLLEGPSPGRHKLLRGKDEYSDDDEDDEDDEDDARGSHAAHAFAPHGGGGGYAPIPIVLPRPNNSSKGLFIAVVAFVLLVVVAGAGIGIAVYLNAQDDEPPARTQPKAPKRR